MVLLKGSERFLDCSGVGYGVAKGFCTMFRLKQLSSQLLVCSGVGYGVAKGSARFLD